MKNKLEGDKAELQITTLKSVLIILLTGLSLALTSCGGGSGGSPTEVGNPLDFTNMPATGQSVSPGETALLEVTGLTPDIFYSVSIVGNNTTELSVYDDPDLTRLLCPSNFG